MLFIGQGTSLSGDTDSFPINRDFAPLGMTLFPLNLMTLSYTFKKIA